MCCVDQGAPRLVVTNKFEKLHQAYTSHKVITPRSAQRPPTDVSDGHGLATAPINKILTKTPVTPRGLSLSLSHCH